MGPGSMSADPPAAAAAEPLIEARLTSLGSGSAANVRARHGEACQAGPAHQKLCLGHGIVFR
jgi:hypothetical protein